MSGMVKTRTPAASNEPILHRILREAWEYARENRPFLAVFDLDSTLFDLTLRVAAIIDDFRHAPANLARFPDACRLLEKVEIRQTDWGLEAPLGRAGIDCNGVFFQELHAHWAQGFFSSNFLKHDEPLPGSVTYVQELHQAGAEIMYLTGRDVPRMYKGTAESLSSRGFPLELPGIELVLKPDARLDDAQFKLDVLRSAEERYERIWLFENEPVNLNLIARECPEIGLVFIDSTHSGREELAPVLDTIVHFECDLEEFRKNLREF